MAATIFERPHNISYSQNEIRYIFELTDFTEPGSALEVRIFARPIGGTYEEITRFMQYPDSAGRINCHIRPYLHSYLTPQLPDDGGTFFTRAESQSRQYYIEYRQVSTATPEPAWVSDSLYFFMVIMGGVEQMKYSRNNFFVNYWPVSHGWLTWLPSGRMVPKSLSHYISFYLEPVNIDILKSAIVVKFVDGHTVSFSGTVTNVKTGVYHVLAGADDLQLEATHPGVKIHWYTIQVKDKNNIPITRPYKFYVDHNNVYQYTDLVYFNSLGGLDAVRIKGDTQWSVQAQSTDVEQLVYNDIYTTKKPTAQYRTINPLKRDNYKGDLGFEHTPEEQEARLEILVSTGIFEKMEGRWIRIVNMKRSQDLRNNSDKKWSFPVEWSYGYDDTVFTPKKVLMGEGQFIAPLNPCYGLAMTVAAFVDIEGVSNGVFNYEAHWNYSTPPSFGTLELYTSLDNVTWTLLPPPYTSKYNHFYNLGSASAQIHWFRARHVCPGDTSIYFDADYHVQP